MDSRRVFRSNLFAMILLTLYVVAPAFLVPVFKSAKLPVSMYLVLPQLLLLIVPTIIYFIITKQPVKDTLKLNKISSKTVLIVIVIGLLAQPIAMFLSLITQFVFPNRISQVVASLNDIPFIIRLGVVALTPAICEEITMRGVVLSGYKNISIRKSAIMTGLFFGMLHLDGNQLLYAFAIGIIFAYLVRITNSIFASMLCHFTINGTQVAMSELSTRLMKLSGQQVETIQQSGLASLSTMQIINTFFLLLTLAIICIGIIVVLMQKLSYINNGYRVNDIDFEKENISVINWPVVVSMTIYVITIFFQLKEIYKW